ncbi:EAL domain-containing protein [Psychromonas sp. PT13]|uniref:EAL domain-containing protein n=1 Tax=Psychromonas sp. PT13 TaxID=3439547 RepID=UPI003EC0C81A
MPKKMPIVEKDNALFSCHWEYEFLTNRFVCQSDYSSFFGRKEASSLTIEHLFSICHFQQVDTLKENIKKVIKTQEGTTEYIFVNGTDGVYLTKVVLTYNKDTTASIIGVLHIIQKIPLEFQGASLLRLFFEKSNRGLIVVNAAYIIIFANELFCESSGYSQLELIGQNLSILDSGEYTSEYYKKLYEKVNSEKIWTGELLSKNKQGQIYAQQTDIQKVVQENGDYFYGIKSELLDISNYSLIHKRKVGYNRKSAILNKKEFTENTQKEYKKLTNTETIVMAAFVVKTQQKITDDSVKWLISNRFDSSGQGGHLGLINDDVFVFCQVVEKNIEQVDILLSRMLKELTVSESSDLDVISNIKMAASILFVDSNSIQQLLTHSVQKLLATPFAEKSLITYFDRRLAKRFNRRQLLAKLIKSALNKGDIEVYYQPVVNIRNMKVSKFEALFRITLDTEMDYDTLEVIAIAEENNWVAQIDSLVNKQALIDLSRLQKYYGDKTLGISLNRSLANDNHSFSCLENAYNTLKNMDMSTTPVILELAEYAFFEDFDKQKTWIEKLQKMGVRIALDDFGAGSSSLSHLNNISVDFIKIDRSFVRNLTLESNEFQIIKMLCKLTHKIGGKVIATGVETVDELQLVAKAKVDSVQGYLFSKPLSIQALLSTPQIVVNETFRKIIHKEFDTSVKDIMKHEFVRIGCEDRLDLARDIMSENETDYLIVIEDHICMGVLYKADLEATLSPYIGTKSENARDLATLNKRVHQIMDKNFYAVDIDSPIDQVEEIFLNKPNSIIVVTGKNSKICHGVVIINDFLNYKYMEEKEI